jgi:hypothetical protein
MSVTERDVIVVPGSCDCSSGMMAVLIANTRHGVLFLRLSGRCRLALPAASAYIAAREQAAARGFR